MYAVVGCGNCTAFWIVEGRPETTGCPRCGKRHRFEKLKRFAESADADEARQARAALLADREGYGETFAELDSFAEMDGQAEASGIDDDAYLERSGLDPEVVSAAGARAERGVARTQSKREIVLDAVSRFDRPTEAEITSYAAERGVSAAYTERALEKFRRNGAVSVTDGRYRLL